MNLTVVTKNYLKNTYYLRKTLTKHIIMKNINLNSVNNVISYYENDNTIETLIDFIRNHPNQNDRLDDVLEDIACVTENFENVFTCAEFLEFIIDSEEKNLYKAIEEAKQLLRNNGYFVDNLWTVEDVRSRFICTDEQAQEVLESALTNEATMEQIWFALDMTASDDGLERIEDDNFPDED